MKIYWIYSEPNQCVIKTAWVLCDLHVRFDRLLNWLLTLHWRSEIDGWWLVLSGVFVWRASLDEPTVGQGSEAAVLLPRCQMLIWGPFGYGEIAHYSWQHWYYTIIL